MKPDYPAIRRHFASLSVKGGNLTLREKYALMAACGTAVKPGLIIPKGQSFYFDLLVAVAKTVREDDAELQNELGRVLQEITEDLRAREAAK